MRARGRPPKQGRGSRAQLKRGGGAEARAQPHTARKHDTHGTGSQAHARARGRAGWPQSSRGRIKEKEEEEGEEGEEGEKEGEEKGEGEEDEGEEDAISFHGPKLCIAK